jgi:hypothetical protein
VARNNRQLGPQTLPTHTSLKFRLPLGKLATGTKVAITLAPWAISDSRSSYGAEASIVWATVADVFQINM